MKITRRQLRRIIKEEKIWTTPEGWDIKVGDKVKITTAQTGKSRHLSAGSTGTVSDIGWGNRGLPGDDPIRQLYLDLILDDDPSKDPMLNSISTQDVELIPEGVARKMKITRRQLRRIIREAIDPREMEEPIGGWVGDALKNDPDFASDNDTDDIPQAVGDLVRTFDFVGDEWGGDYEKVVGDQVGQVIEIEDDIDGAQFTVLFPDGTKIMDNAMAFEMAR